MKLFFVLAASVTISLASSCQSAQSNADGKAQGKDSTSSNQHSETKNLYLDMHHLGAGKVKYDEVAKAHAKDLAVQGKYGVNFLKYWVDEKAGTVYCLASAPDTQSLRKTHGEAHGLMPDQIYQVTGGTEAALNNEKNFFLDIHHVGAGKVTAQDVAGAHQKDLAVEQMFGVNFVNYWVNEKEGLVVCLSQAPDSNAIINTHKKAHGLLPDQISSVKQGQ